MAPSTPSWRPPHHGVGSTASQAGENDQTNVATQKWRNRRTDMMAYSEKWYPGLEMEDYWTGKSFIVFDDHDEL